VWKEVISPTAERLEEFRVKPKRFYAVGDHVMVIGYFHGRGKATGRELEAATIHVCTLRNGKIVRFEAFHDPAQWLETLGVAQSEPQRMAA
jgi:ketosteroid isomerase-like protein